jgi:hypothetical protein
MNEIGRGGGGRTRVQIYLTPTFSAPCVSDGSEQLTTFDDLYPFGSTSLHDTICSGFNPAGIKPAHLARWHDLRRTCARLCHESGGELEEIQFLLGHVSAQPTERYLGCKQRLREAVNDKIGLETLRCTPEA